jgi:hypothetical protein
MQAEQAGRLLLLASGLRQRIEDEAPLGLAHALMEGGLGAGRRQGLFENASGRSSSSISPVLPSTTARSMAF